MSGNVDPRRRAIIRADIERRVMRSDRLKLAERLAHYGYVRSARAIVRDAPGGVVVIEAVRPPKKAP